MQTMSNWMGFDADFMRLNPEARNIITELTIGELQDYWEKHWKGGAVELVSRIGSEEETINAGVLHAED